jgi:hypothetical protein
MFKIARPSSVIEGILTHHGPITGKEVADTSNSILSAKYDRSRVMDTSFLRNRDVGNAL